MKGKKKSKTIAQLKHKKYKLTDQVISDLQGALNQDFTVEEACLYAGIAQDTYYRWVKESEEFKDLMRRAKLFVFFKAKQNIAECVVKGSIEDSWKLLSKRQKELYSDRQEMTGSNGESIKTEDVTSYSVISIEKRKKILEILKSEKQDPIVF